MFQPALFGRGQTTKSVQDLVTNAILASPDFLRPNLVQNILLSGGGSNLTGFTERMEKELTSSLSSICDSFDLETLASDKSLGLSRIPKDLRVTTKKYFSRRVLTKPNPENHVWIGGSILGRNLADLKMITPEQYDEIGPSVGKLVSWENVQNL